MPKLLDHLGASHLSITDEQAMLPAQAILETVILITRDAALRALPGLLTIW